MYVGHSKVVQIEQQAWVSCSSL